MSEQAQNEAGNDGCSVTVGLPDEAERSALAECASYSRDGSVTPYWFRQATMRRLQARGLVEPYSPIGRNLRKRPAWRVTAAGMTLLRSLGVPVRG